MNKSARETWIDEHGPPIVGDDWCDFILTQLQGVLDDGLPARYKNVREFNNDLWVSDMPWVEDDWAVVLHRIETDPRYPDIRQRWDEKFGDAFWRTVTLEESARW